MKSFRPKCDTGGDNNGWADFRGHKRSNDTHESKPDPESKLMRKGNGREAKLCFMGHALMENRNGLLVDLRISEANGRAERETALEMLAQHAGGGATVGADRGYDTKDFWSGSLRFPPTRSEDVLAQVRARILSGRPTGGP